MGVFVAMLASIGARRMVRSRERRHHGHAHRRGAVGRRCNRGECRDRRRDGGDGEHRHNMSTYKPDSEVSRVNRQRREGADGDQPRVVRSADDRARVLADHRRRVRHHVRERRLHVRLPRAQETDGGRDRIGAAGGELSPRRARRRKRVPCSSRSRACASISAASARAMRSIAASRFCRRTASRTRWSRPAATAASSAIVSAKPWIVGIRHPDDKDARHREDSAGRHRDVDFGRLRALLRRRRRALSPHHRSAYRANRPARCAARRFWRRPRRAPTDCRRPHSCSAPKRR